MVPIKKRIYTTANIWLDVWVETCMVSTLIAVLYCFLLTGLYLPYGQ